MFDKLAKTAQDRTGVQSLVRAFSILEEIARNRDGIRLAHLSKRVGLHNSTTFHLVKTMVGLGYVRQAKDNKRYRIGRPLFTLAAGALDEVELVSLSSPFLEDLTLATGETSHFAVMSGDEIVVIAKTEGTGAFRMTDRVGVVRPAHCTALGKVLLASLTPARLDHFLETHELRTFTPRTVTEPDRLRDEIKEVRHSSIAYDDGEFHSEVRCAAVPVRDFTGRIAGALGISGPIWRLSIPRLQESTAKLREVADRLSAELGYQPQSEESVAKLQADRVESESPVS